MRYRLTNLHGLPVALLLGCSGSDSPTENENPGGGSTVSVTNNAFSPSPIAVAVNATVTWQWNSGGVAHNVTFNDGTASATQSSGSFPRTFQAAGSFPYVCTIHVAEGMTGVVTVSASTGGSGGAGDDDTDGGGGYP
jgi:plastocyanin